MFLIKLKNGFDVDQAVEDLEIEGVKVIWSTEEQGLSEIVVDDIWGDWPFVQTIESYEPETVDWEKQWKEFAPAIMEGINVGTWMIKMKPGPGFGNLSHPTTVLMLELMEGEVEGKCVVDIGCGSGILGLAAIAMNASEVWAVDIDEQALEHAKANAELNEMTMNFGIPENGEVFLMNMILSEQKEALKTIPLQGLLIVSGILDEKEYLEFAKDKGWKLEKKKEKEGWLAFTFRLA